MESQKNEYSLIEKGQHLTEWQSAIRARCPRCRTGAMFEGATYGLKAQKMYKNCPHCNLRYEREPGYFYVSMFVSYAFSVAQMIAICLLVYLITGNDSSFWLYLGAVLAIVFILAPFNFRYSRVVQMYWLSPGLKFDPALATTKKQKSNSNQ